MSLPFADSPPSSGLGIFLLIEAVKQLRGTADLRQVPGAEAALVSGWAAQEHAISILSNS